MSQADVELGLATSHLIKVVRARIDAEVVNIVDGESAGHSRLIVAVAVGEGGVEAHHGQVVSLDLTLERFEGLACERTFFYLREMPGNLLAGVTHLRVVHRSVQELR